MTSWVYVFSQFTPEALLFEILLISILIAGYAAFWVLHKRKYGAAEDAPGVVKGYLNELIRDAEKIRMQLFGLLGADAPALSIPQSMPQLDAVPANVSIDAALAKNIAQLETKLTEQASALERVASEKLKLEQELSAAKTATVNASVAGPVVDAGANLDLQNKLKALEDKLAEYSVIEDDLANLKRLQQENAQLKAALGGNVPKLEEPVKPAEPVAPVVTGQVETVDQSSIDALFAVPAETAPAAEPEAVLEAVAAPVAPDLAFEGLVDQVEKSLQPDAPSGAVAAAAPIPAEAPAAAAPATSVSTSTPAPASIEKSDADLVAEFEKMLSG